MRQLSLFDNAYGLAGALPAVKAVMRRILGPEGDENRKGFVDKLNAIASQAQVPLTGGNVKSMSLDMLNKILSPSDTSHPPSVLFVLVFCKAANDYEPFAVLANALGFELMGEEDKRLRDYGKAIVAEKAARKKKKQLEEQL